MISNRIWLAAYYHFPATYSIRSPMTSTNSALVLPAPSPSTVRLALMRTGVELFGLPYVREVVFPSICRCKVLISPPDKVAMSNQSSRGFKVAYSRNGAVMIDSYLYREVAHAVGCMAVYINVEEQMVAEYSEMFSGIGYWGTTNSFTQCQGCEMAEPKPGTYMMPLQSSKNPTQIRNYFRSFVSEFEDTVTWDAIQAVPIGPQNRALKVQVYVYPLLIQQRVRGNTVLINHPLIDMDEMRETMR